MEKLKPCPYCGNEDVKLMRMSNYYGVVCENYFCDRITERYFNTEEQAVREWDKEIESVKGGA